MQNCNWIILLTYYITLVYRTTVKNDEIVYQTLSLLPRLQPMLGDALGSLLT